MATWIPGTAMLGLLCLMIFPAPGVWGVLIGIVCVLVIFCCAVLYLLDQLATRILMWRAQAKRGRRARAVHAGSGISKKI